MHHRKGKAKIIYATENPEEYLVYYKDDATAGNGAKRGTIADKGIMNNKMTAFFFDLLAKEGIAHHYISMPSELKCLSKSSRSFPLRSLSAMLRQVRSPSALGWRKVCRCRSR